MLILIERPHLHYHVALHLKLVALDFGEIPMSSQLPISTSMNNSPHPSKSHFLDSPAFLCPRHQINPIAFHAQQVKIKELKCTFPNYKMYVPSLPTFTHDKMCSPSFE